jgi:hypothetical protein
MAVRSNDNRRVIIASIVTVVAIPALWIMNGDSSKSSSVVAGSTIATAPPTTKYKPETPVFVEEQGQTPAQGGVININVAPAPSANSFVGKASFRRYPNTLTRPCTVPVAPDAAIITVINVDNGQSTSCNNILTFQPPAGIDIVLHTVVFSEIGDVADSPIDVRVTW